jgi:hypothetical protein
LIRQQRAHLENTTITARVGTGARYFYTYAMWQAKCEAHTTLLNAIYDLKNEIEASAKAFGVGSFERRSRFAAFKAVCKLEVEMEVARESSDPNASAMWLGPRTQQIDRRTNRPRPVSQWRDPVKEPLGSKRNEGSGGSRLDEFARYAIEFTQFPITVKSQEIHRAIGTGKEANVRKGSRAARFQASNNDKQNREIPELAKRALPGVPPRIKDEDEADGDGALALTDASAALQLSYQNAQGASVSM